MRCHHCGQEIDEGVKHCMYCGSKQIIDAPAVPESAPDLQTQEVESGNAEPWKQDDGVQNVAAPSEPVYTPPAAPTAVAAPAAPVTYVQSTRPVLQLPTGRGMLKMIFLGLITLGIYNIVIYSKMATEINIVASRHDGRRTMPYMAMCALTPFTLGILPWVWNHKLCNRIGYELDRRGCGYKFSAATFWLWGILGSLILVGPFIYLHKLMKGMNLINSSFNKIG